MRKEAGKHRFTLKDPEATKAETRMEISVDGVPVPRNENEGEDDGKLSSLDALMAASFALSGNMRTSLRVNGSVAETHGFEADRSGESAVFHYRPGLNGKEGRSTFEERWEAIMGEAAAKEDFDALFADGIFENRELQKVITGVEPPLTAAFEIEADAFGYDLEVATAEFKLTR